MVIASSQGLGKAIAERFVHEAAIPLRRYGEPNEFTNIVLFLASALNTYMTGNTFLVDGGMVKSL